MGTFILQMTMNTDYAILDSTAIGDWSLIEPAVEVFSASLPTMTPFLHVRLQWNKLRSSLHSASSKSSKAGKFTGKDHKFHEIQSAERQDPSNGESGPVADVSGTAIPMHSIAVRQEMQWSESQRQMIGEEMRKDWNAENAV